MRKPLKKAARNDRKPTIKLISAQRTECRQSSKGEKEKVPFLCFGSAALSLQLELLYRHLSLDLVLAVYQLLGIQLFWLLPYFPAPAGSLCQDLDLHYLLSLPVPSGINCLFPSLNLVYQSRLEGHQEEINSYSSPGSHKMALSDQTIFHLLTQGVGMVGSQSNNRCILERGSRIMHNKKINYISFVRLYQKKRASLEITTW